MGRLTARAVMSAPAKLNLRLRIKGVRKDGFHLIDTDMVPVSLADRLIIRTRPDGEIVCSHSRADMPAEKDLCLRAAKLLQQRTGCAKGADIRVWKRIPSGAGMGGGSSDAAAVLLGLSRIWDLGASRNDLSGIALELGADVPFFLHRRPMRARGVGERLEPLRHVPQHFLVVQPDWTLDTGDVYRKYDDLLESRAPASGSGVVRDMGPNDLAAAAAALSPPGFASLAGLMYRNFGNVCMTGSGSALFSRCPRGTIPRSRDVCENAPTKLGYAGIVKALGPEAGWGVAKW